MSNLADEIRQFCVQNRLRLNTDLGQHFLIDQEVLDAIVARAHLSPADTVVEIGPGLGVLTRELLRCAGKVQAIELDHRLIPLLLSFTHAHPNLEVTQGNALHVALPRLPYKMVANIPYHITSPLLRHVFLESEVMPVSLTLLMQREVAENICDTRNAGMLTILVALFGEPSMVVRVPATAFLPPPKVESAVLHIACFHQPRTDQATIDRIFRLTKHAFGQKRKMLRNTLGTLPDGMALLQRAGIDPERRPQTLDIDEWIHLARSIEA